MFLCCSSERDAASLSAARTEDTSYGQIIIREAGDQQRIRERDAASVYSAVRTEDITYGQIIIRPKRTRGTASSPSDLSFTADRRSTCLSDEKVSCLFKLTRARQRKRRWKMERSSSHVNVC
ncbi:hypothetical protein CHARACLAT_031871 [Characodon lateralis]|uniref:Uncharacterized protein n=1 Tax=Characodon lateralis TaxID=208331 RepID=A0ABU7CVZ5_9TELE|nr:hypothetical protein [Characodon lateralis]